MGFSNPITGGQGALARDQIKSPGFVAGSTGWSINRDGSAEFNNVVIRGGATIGGTSLYYNGTPALGNLIASISAAGGTDPFGNAYQAGIIAYGNASSALIMSTDGSRLIAMNEGKLQIDQGALAPSTDAGTLYLNLPGGMVLTSGLDTAGGTDDAATLGLSAGQKNQPSQALGPSLTLVDHDLTSAVDLYLSGVIVPTTASGIPYTWQTPTPYKPNWSAGTQIVGLGGNALQYRVMPDDTLWINGLAKTAAGAGTTVFTLPAAYRPASGTTPHGQCARYSAGAYSTAEVAIVGTTGDVIISAAPAAGDEFSFNVRIPFHRIP